MDARELGSSGLRWLVTRSLGRAYALVVVSEAGTADARRVRRSGKDPMIALDGVDVQSVPAEVVATKFSRSGQRCEVPETVIVHVSVHDELVARLADACAAAKVGDATDPETVIASLSSAKVPGTVAGQLADARERGAHIICGGKIEDQLAYPTVVTGVIGR
jgi:acyl-CoA reductase-like NAD-dependent aldehyde dehydrogenase